MGLKNIYEKYKKYTKHRYKKYKTIGFTYVFVCFAYIFCIIHNIFFSYFFKPGPPDPELEGLICRGGARTPDFYKGFTIGFLAKFLKSLIWDFVEGLGNYSLPRIKN